MKVYFVYKILVINRKNKHKWTYPTNILEKLEDRTGTYRYINV